MHNIAMVCMMVVGAFFVLLSPVSPTEPWFAGHIIVLEQLTRFFEAMVYVLGSLALIKYLQN